MSGGLGDLSYYWLNGSGTADSLYGLSAGIYTLVVIDSLSLLIHLVFLFQAHRYLS